MSNAHHSDHSAGALYIPDERVLQVTGLSVEFETLDTTVRAVKDVSFHVSRGETLAIVGESGSGKSVTSLSLLRLVEFGHGRIVDGQILLRHRNGTVTDLAVASDQTLRTIRGSDIAMIFQEPMTSLNPSYTAGSQIIEALQLHQAMDKAAAHAEMRRLLDVVRIPDAAAVSVRYPHQLSGGMRQRIMIAMALSCQPQILIADEPTTALDVTIQAQILQLIRQLQEEMHMGVIFITHDMGVVAEVADRVMVMCKGEKVEENTCETLFSAPQHPYTQALFSAVPRLGSMSHTDYPMPFELMRVHTGPDTTRAPATAATTTAATATAETKVVSTQAISTARYDEPPLLQVKNLVTRFDLRSGLFGRVGHRVHAVEQVSFDLFPGETQAIVGESGCGKTTTGRSLAQLEQPQEGSILFRGQNMAALSAAQRQAWRKHIQFIFQDPFGSLDPRMTVGDSIMEPLLIHDVCKGREAKERVRVLMEKCGLTPEMANRYPHEFSGGQRQRVCIARALALNPQVLIADESVSALDVSIQAQIVNLLLDLQRELGLSILFISHDMAVVERISHRIMVMYMGQVVEKGPRRVIFEQPQHPYTRALMAAVPVADPESRHRRRSLMVSEIPSVIRRVGDVPDVQPLVVVGHGHFVARHPIGAY